MPPPADRSTADSALTALALDRPDRFLIDGILEAAREYLDMDVAFASEFVGDEQVIRAGMGLRMTPPERRPGRRLLDPLLAVLERNDAKSSDGSGGFSREPR